MFIKRGDSKILTVISDKNVKPDHKKLASELIEQLNSEDNDKKEDKSSNNK